MIDKSWYHDDDELNTREAANVAGHNRRTIVAWIRDGKLPATRRPGKRGHYRIRWADLYAALHRPVVPAAPER